MITRAIHDAVVLSTTPQKIRTENPLKIGHIFQNQESVANIFIRSGSSGAERSYLKLLPSQPLLEDILPPQEEIWAYSDVAGAILTLVEKYRAA